MKFKSIIAGSLIVLFLMTAFIIAETRQQEMQEQLDLFGEFYHLVNKQFVDTINLPDLMKRTMNKTLGELDMYSHYYDSAETQKQRIAWKGILYAGIGSGVKQTDSGVVVTYPYPDMPAMNAGLRTGDFISEINGRNVQTLPIDSVIKLLKGNEGDSLWLSIKRPYAGIIKVGLARKKIIDKAVPLYFLLDDSTGYVKLNHFLFGAAGAFRNSLTELKKKGMKKLVIDIRGNSGGSVEETALALSSLLPLNTLVCSLKLKDSTKNYSNRTLEQPVDTLMPILLLTDRKTISSGEIFAGCLKDHKRALLIGDRTWGKGYVQGTNFFKNGASLYITEARYYTPSGKFIGDRGVDPDIDAITPDSIPGDFRAILSSGIITNYCIMQRYAVDKDSFSVHKISHKDFSRYYIDHIFSIKLPEESLLASLGVYSSGKQLKKEIETRKRKLPYIYEKEIELELRKEMLRQDYQYAAAGKIEFEHSGMFEFLVQKGYLERQGQ